MKITYGMKLLDYKYRRLNRKCYKLKDSNIKLEKSIIYLFDLISKLRKALSIKDDMISYNAALQIFYKCKRRNKKLNERKESKILP